MNDVLSDMDIQLVNDKSFPIEAKFHKGFYERAQKFLAEFGLELEKYPDLEKIVLTGHSLGAAVSAVTHILLVQELKDR